MPNIPDSDSDSNHENPWARLVFANLKMALDSDYTSADSSNLKLRARFEDIQNYLENDDNFRPGTPSTHIKFDPVLREVLARLPQHVFDLVESNIIFVIEDPELEILALNVTASNKLPSNGGKDTLPREQAKDTIVVFRTTWPLSPQALIGLIAHEIAHSFVRGKNYPEDECLANKKARAWGFENELDQLKKEKKAPQRSTQV